jgi:hypothetical protein
MGTLKKVGRKRRRMEAQVDEMHPDKLYTLRASGKAMTRTGKAWKAVKEAAKG